MANDAKATENGNGALSEDEVLEVLATGRVRNQYEPRVVEFRDSDEKGVDPAKYWAAEFGSKQVTTLMQGLNGAIKKLELEDRIQVIKRGDRCVMIDKSKLSLPTA